MLNYLYSSDCLRKITLDPSCERIHHYRPDPYRIAGGSIIVLFYYAYYDNTTCLVRRIVFTLINAYLCSLLVVIMAFTYLYVFESYFCFLMYFSYYNGLNIFKFLEILRTEIRSDHFDVKKKTTKILSNWLALRTH